MLGTIKAGVVALAEFLGIVSWFQRRAEAKRNFEAGRVKQRLESLEATKEQASEANRIDEDVRRLDDDALYRELRNRPADNG